MSAFNLNKPVFTSFIVHSESASRCDASVDSTAEADPGLFAPNNSIPQQQGMDERTKNTSFDHMYASIYPHVLADQTKSVSKWLETLLTQPTTEKGASSTAIHGDKEEASNTIKLEDLAKVVPNLQPNFKDLDSPEDDPIIMVDDSDEDEEDEEHTTNVETEDTSVPKSSSPSSLLTKLKDLPSKFNELTKEVKGLKTQVHNLEIELLGDLKEIPPKLDNFTKTVTTQAKLKTLDALPNLLLNVTKALNKFAQVLESTSSKAGDQSVPAAGQADTMPAEGEKDTT
ncbi:hypothetical protein Tco_1039201 [Tanacetum coccineum]